jgi:NO-binding membrane sensor protein with MHYT domain
MARACAASIFMGWGIAALHHTSMWAICLEGTCSYSPRIVAFSVVLAIAFSLISLWLTFVFRNDSIALTRREFSGALLMGAAVSGIITPVWPLLLFTRSAVTPNLPHAVSISALGATGISIVALFCSPSLC